MVFLANLDASRILFTYALFGVQHDELTSAKLEYVSTLHKLISQSANRVDHLQQENPENEESTPASTTFVAYWLHSEDYEKWKNTDAVKEFWDSLPDDAGVWREVMTIPKSRFTAQQSQNVPKGFASLVGQNHSSDEGYWGANRHRLEATPDRFTEPGDRFDSEYETSARLRPDPSKKIIEIPGPATSSPGIRRGRVKLTNIPNNLAFARDSQSLENPTQEEQTSWTEKLNPLFRTWVDHLNTERNQRGVLSLSCHVGYERSNSDAPIDNFDAAENLARQTRGVPEKTQLLYFLDLAHFELAGRSFKNHVELVKTVFALYGPGGSHSTGGKLSLLAELAILKSDDLDAEYIGCKEGTGLMFLEGLDQDR